MIQRPTKQTLGYSLGAREENWVFGTLWMTTEETTQWRVIKPWTQYSLWKEDKPCCFSRSEVTEEHNRHAYQSEKNGLTLKKVLVASDVNATKLCCLICAKLYKTLLPYIALMHTLHFVYPTPCMPSPYSIHPPHACPPPILSHSMHTLPLFYPSPMHDIPNSIQAHAHPPPITVYSTPCMPYLYSIPPNACPISTLSHPMHALFLLSPSPHKTPQYSILFQPMHVLLTPCHIHLEGIFSFDIWVCHIWICSHWVYHHHYLAL